MRRDELTPALIARMSPEDQRRYGPPTNLKQECGGEFLEEDSHPPTKTYKLERQEQRELASWLMLRNYPFVWHATHKRSTANVGCPDFIVVIANMTHWIELKAPQQKLSPDQEKFRARLAAQGVQLHVCYSAYEAIKLLDPNDKFLQPLQRPARTGPEDSR